jgi:hypothetical protein
MVFLFARKEFICIGFNGNGLGGHTQTIHGLCIEINPINRSKNVASGAFSCAFVPILSEGEPAKWLKIKNLSIHLCDFEPGGRRFESVRARFSIKGPTWAKGIL